MTDETHSFFSAKDGDFVIEKVKRRRLPDGRVLRSYRLDDVVTYCKQEDGSVIRSVRTIIQAELGK